MAPLKGVHRVRITIASGRAEYWYAWRGGPKILSESATSDRVLDLKVNAAAIEAGRLYFELHAAKKAPQTGVIAALVRDWLASPEFANASPRTQKDRKVHLKVIEADLGDLPIVALEARGARKVLIDWRNRYKRTPCSADLYCATLSQLLSWARGQGETAADPMRDWPKIYKVDRSGILWTAGEIEAVCIKAEPELQRAILLAAYSGLRQGDLLKLTWSAIDEPNNRIIRRTGKKGRVVYIPITPTLQAVLDACPKGDSTQILTKDGAPWKASTLHKAWGLARQKAVKTCPSIAGKRWHDLRGTFATLLIRGGATDEDVDRTMGWSRGNSEQTRASYVSGDVVAEATITRLQRFTASA